MRQRYQLEQLGSIKNRALFFDANLLLYIFWPTQSSSNQWAISAYSSLFAECIKQKIPTCMDAWVLSEFINRAIRLEKDKTAIPDFKIFRKSDEGRQAMRDIHGVVQSKILKCFDVVGKAFDKSDLTSINLENNDFNDQLIQKTCEKYGCILATNDADFVASSLDIISANRKLVPNAASKA